MQIGRRMGTDEVRPVLSDTTRRSVTDCQAIDLGDGVHCSLSSYGLVDLDIHRSSLVSPTQIQRLRKCA